MNIICHSLEDCERNIAECKKIIARYSFDDRTFARKAEARFKQLLVNLYRDYHQRLGDTQC